MASERELIEQIKKVLPNLLQAVADAPLWQERWLTQAKETHQAETARLEEEAQRAKSAAQNAYQSVLETLITPDYQQELQRAEGKCLWLERGCMDNMATFLQSAAVAHSSR